MVSHLRGVNEPTIEGVARDAECARLRAQGHTLQEIADEVGYAQGSSVRLAIQRALILTAQEAGDELRALELQRMDMLLNKAWAAMDETHPTVSQGRVVMHDGKPVADVQAMFGAMDRILRIMERRAKLLGLDAPTRHTVLSVDLINAEIEKLERELAARAVTDGDRAAGETPPTP